jgi:hypothetical protein
VIDTDRDDHGPIEYGSVIDDVTETWEEMEYVEAAALGVWDRYRGTTSDSVQVSHPAYEVGKAHVNPVSASTVPMPFVSMAEMVGGGK